MEGIAAARPATGTMFAHSALAEGTRNASHNVGFSSFLRTTSPPSGDKRIPAAIASWTRRWKRLRRMNDRKIMAEETNSSRNSVARKVNLEDDVDDDDMLESVP